METSFRRASRLLSPAERVAIEVVLREWQMHPIGRVVASNLRDGEHFLPTNSMHSLILVLLSARSAPINELQTRYQNECYRHQRKGGTIRVAPLPETLGRAVGTGEFINYLFRRYSTYFPKKRHAKDFVSRLKAGAPIDPWENDLLMAEFTTWVTWDTTASDPFDFVEYGLAVEVRAALGLDQRKTTPLLLMRYKRPEKLQLFRPTIADAGLFPYFDPPIGSETAHSYTRPWPAKRVTGIPKELSAAPRPEAVHLPVEVKYVIDMSEVK